MGRYMLWINDFDSSNVTEGLDEIEDELDFLWCHAPEGLSDEDYQESWLYIRKNDDLLSKIKGLMFDYKESINRAKSLRLSVNTHRNYGKGNDLLESKW